MSQTQENNQLEDLKQFHTLASGFSLRLKEVYQVKAVEDAVPNRPGIVLLYRNGQREVLTGAQAEEVAQLFGINLS